jgi:hypothetical protein
MQPVTKMYFFGIFTALLHDMKPGSTEDSSEPLLSYFHRLFPLNKEKEGLVRAKFHPRLSMIPHHQIGIIPNSTHGVFLENFPAVWACVKPFLNQ